MTEHLQGERLLETARELLFDELLPALPPQARHAALMVANAMAIAARTLDRLQAEQAAQASEARAAADRRLCESIRQHGVGVGAEARQLHARLLADVRARVELSNPKVLGRRTGTAP